MKLLGSLFIEQTQIILSPPSFLTMDSRSTENPLSLWRNMYGSCDQLHIFTPHSWTIIWLRVSIKLDSVILVWSISHRNLSGDDPCGCCWLYSLSNPQVLENSDNMPVPHLLHPNWPLCVVNMFRSMSVEVHLLVYNHDILCLCAPYNFNHFPPTDRTYLIYMPVVTNPRLPQQASRFRCDCRSL